MLRVRYYGDPILRKKAERVMIFDDSLREFIGEMVVAMHEYDGVGLAASQVGNSIQLAVIEPVRDTGDVIVLINPEIVAASKELVEHEEGCLSFPDLHVKLSRPKMVSVKAYDEFGKEFTIENAQDLLCRALQHEIDHLNGLFIIDHISLLQRKLLKGKLKKISEMQSEEKAFRGSSASAL